MKCLYCGKELTNRQKKYCSNACQVQYQNQELLHLWKNGEYQWPEDPKNLPKFIRDYLLEKTGYKCEECGWNKINPFSGKTPLQIHHRDGNYKNNTENNLQVLCPNCHSLTSTYMSLNKKGRKTRLINNKENKKVGKFCVDCGEPIHRGSERCKRCASLKRQTQKPVNREELKNLIRTTPFTDIAKQFNVSPTTITKWCDFYQLPKRKKEILVISDQDWAFI